MRLRYHAREEIEKPNFIIACVLSDGFGCTVFTNEAGGVAFDGVFGKGIVQLRTPLKLIAGKYTLHVLVRQQHDRGIERCCAHKWGALSSTTSPAGQSLWSLPRARDLVFEGLHPTDHGNCGN